MTTTEQPSRRTTWSQVLERAAKRAERAAVEGRSVVIVVKGAGK